MPLPGLRAGDATSFDFEYFAPSRVMAARGDGVGGLLGRSDPQITQMTQILKRG
jgi:hypothetical protein